MELTHRTFQQPCWPARLCLARKEKALRVKINSAVVVLQQPFHGLALIQAYLHINTSTWPIYPGHARSSTCFGLPATRPACGTGHSPHVTFTWWPGDHAWYVRYSSASQWHGMVPLPACCSTAYGRKRMENTPCSAHGRRKRQIAEAEAAALVFGKGPELLGRILRSSPARTLPPWWKPWPFDTR